MAAGLMRIVQVAGFYGPQSGGLRTCVDALGAGYQAAGFDRVLIVPGARDAHEMTSSGRRITLRGPQIPASGGYRAIVDRRRLATVVTRLVPDRLEVSDKLLAPFLGRLARDLGVPAVLLSHERLDGILASRLPRGFPREAVADRWNHRAADAYQAIVAASGWAAEEFERIRRAVIRSPLGVDLDTFRPDRATAASGDGQVVLACVTRLSKEKGPELAVDTLRALRRDGVDARLVMVGAGPMEECLRRSAATLPVTFTGHLAHAVDVAGVLAGADVSLSCCPVETFGLAALESMAWTNTVARMLAAHGVGGLQVAC